VDECHNKNEKFSDAEFDIEGDYLDNCQLGLTDRPAEIKDGPGSVHRIDWIFDQPSFLGDGSPQPISSKETQGTVGGLLPWEH
jgi:hypothetical protein